MSSAKRVKSVWSVHTTTAQAAAEVFFPLDERLGLGENAFSPELAKQLLWLAAQLPYEGAAQVMERIGKRLVSASSIWDLVKRYGPRLKAEQARRERQVSMERVVLPGQDLDIQRGLSLDGGMVHLRGEGWKEIKVGASYEVELKLERDSRSGELVEQAHAAHTHYCAVLGSREEFSPALWALAVERQIPQAFRSSVTADGAEWIWTLADDDYPDSVQIVDWFHAVQHLAEAANALFPNDSEAARRWRTQREDDLFMGRIHRLTRPLDKAGLQKHSHYFHTHKRRMQYHAFREEGYPIGSGSVESAIKQFKARLTGPGMRWSRPSAEVMLILRAAVLSDSFDALWDAA